MNGTWLANTPFPAEYASAGIGIMLFEKAQNDVHAILLEAAAAGDAATPDMRRLGGMYTSFMDEKRVEERGIAPLAPPFADFAAIDGPKSLAAFFGTAQGRGINVPIGIYVSPDGRNSTHNVAYLTQDGLGMPNRDYYLREDETYATFRSKYVDYLAKLLTLAGEADGAERAAKILELETQIARDQWTPVQNRDPVKTYNRHGIESATALAPDYDWKAFLAATGLSAGDFIIRQPSHATALGKQMGSAGLSVWKDYLKVRTIGAYARVLPAAFVEASFDFNSRTLRGTESLRPRWKRAVVETDNAIGSVIGHEISHGFDDRGCQYDGDGNLRNWWTAEDNEKFKQRADGLVRQYSSFVALPGLNVNGELTLGENIGDLSGAAVSYSAYRSSLGGSDAPVIDGYKRGAALLPGFCPGMAHQVARRTDARDCADQPAFTERIPRQWRGRQHGRVLRSLRRARGGQALASCR